jgi:hypothetical protein
MREARVVGTRALMGILIEHNTEFFEVPEVDHSCGV